jgi:hypothetical protein
MFEHRRFGLEQAVIARLKENTRRRVRFPKGINDKDVESAVMGIDPKGRVYFTFSVATHQGTETVDVYPKYQIGEQVAVAQSYKTCWDYYQKQWEAKNDPSDWHTPDAILGDSVQETPGYHNKLFVHADLMPHVIEITDIKAERLQDISDEDCMKEGVELEDWRNEYKWGFYTSFFINARTGGQGCRSVWYNSPQKAFGGLIDRINGRGTWQRNEWQFAYTFKLIK